MSFELLPFANSVIDIPKTIKAGSLRFNQLIFYVVRSSLWTSTWLEAQCFINIISIFFNISRKKPSKNRKVNKQSVLNL